MPDSKTSKNRKESAETVVEDLSPSVTFVEDEQAINLHESEGEPSGEGALKIPDDLPILPLRGLVVYPQTAIPLTIGQPRSVRLVDEVVMNDRLIGLVAAKDPDQETPGPGEIFQSGTLSTIQPLFRAPDGPVPLLFQSIARTP